MKKIYLILFLNFLLSDNCYSQLRLLFGQESKIERKNLEVFEKYNFSVVYANNVYKIMQPDGLREIFVPDVKVYYETFGDQYLLATELDSTYIKNGSSSAPFFVPRKRVYIIPTKSIDSKNVYFVNFENIIISEEGGMEYCKGECFLIKKIDIKNKKIKIYSLKSKKYHTFILYKMK